jgi:ParB family chromosome partitioning protein
MNEIMMIPINQLRHHPQNPRLDLGDLTELTNSIKANGILQNLTVVFADPDQLSPEDQKSGYHLMWVVIGNRRFEAAKLAGLEELPCVISDMDDRTQVATMLMENMQRADLTVYEQAQGFQMMMNLGYSAAEIADKTGFGKTTVRRRIKMAEMDPKLLKKACEEKGENRQITLLDFDRLAQVESVKERNALLKEIGDGNFEWKLKRSLQVQESHKVRKDALKALKEAGLKEIKQNERYTGKYSQLYGKGVKLYNWKPGEKILPASKEELFYYIDDTEVEFYIQNKPQKKEKAPEKSEAEKEEEKRRALAWKTVDRCAETAAELRKQYAKDIGVNPKNAMRMMQWALVAAFLCITNYNTPSLTIKNRFEIKSCVDPEGQEQLAKKMMDLPQSSWPELILLMFDGDYEGMKNRPPMFADGSRSWQYPKYKKNVQLELCYEWLTEFGYSMSTEEIEMMTGEHECFKMEAKK